MKRQNLAQCVLTTLTKVDIFGRWLEYATGKENGIVAEIPQIFKFQLGTAKKSYPVIY